MRTLIKNRNNKHGWGGRAVAWAPLAGLLFALPGRAQTVEVAAPAAAEPTAAVEPVRPAVEPPAPTPEQQRTAELEARVKKLEEALAEKEAARTGPALPFPYNQLGASAGSVADRWSVTGYGEFIGATRFFHPDPNKADTPYTQSELDLARVSLSLSSSISDWLTFSSELEFEHGGTGAAREVEWEEFGEYETEIEKGGEVNLEQAFLEAKLPRGFVLRAGHLLVPVGIATSYHLPTMFSAVHRPESESRLVPVVWHENGAEVQWRQGSWNVKLQASTGLDSTGFSSQRWIAGGTQRAFEFPLINDVGLALLVESNAVPKTLIGLSGYTSGTTRNRPKRELDDVAARVFLGDMHFRGQYGPLRLRGLAMLGTLTSADRVNAANASLSSALGAPRTPVGAAAYACWFESALDVTAALRIHTLQRVDAFVRYDAYDTMWKSAGASDNPLLQRQVLTAGVNYFPHPRVVLKAEYLSRWINQGNDWALRQNELNASLGFVL